MRPWIPLGVAIGAAIIVPVALSATGDITRVSLPASGVQLSQAADGPVISADGTRVLFTSTGAFSGVSTGGVRQLFSRELAGGTVQLVSATAAGFPASAAVADEPASAPYASSYDGRFVVFASSAPALVASDANGSQIDVFRKDLLTGAISIVSRDLRGVQPSAGVVGTPSISADGSRVAFASGSQPLTPDDTNAVPDIYVADLRAQTLTLVSQTAGGAQSAEATGHPSISADGRLVAFEGTAAASVLAAADTDAAADVYVARVATRAITLASTPGTGDASLPSLSGDGTRVAFLMAGTGAQVRDVTTRTTTDVPQSGTASRPVIANDGARVASASSTTPAAVNVFTLTGATTTRASQTAAGATLGGPASRPALSGNGAVAGFAFNDGPAPVTPVPVAGDTNRVVDVFTTQMGGGDIRPPTLSARASASGARVVISGRATDASGVIGVLVAGRRATVAADGTYAVTLLPSVGAVTLGVTARDGNGLQATTSVSTARAWAAALQASAPARPRALRATVRGGRVRVRFITGFPGFCRVELRQRVSGRNLHASSYRLIAARQRRQNPGTHVVNLPVASGMRHAFTYQVRVLMSSARGLGTAATTFVMP